MTERNPSELIDQLNSYNTAIWKIVDKYKCSFEKARKIYEQIPGHLERPKPFTGVSV